MDAFLCKLTVDGTALAYSTYLGGGGFSERYDIGTAVAVDNTGAAYVAGLTTSEDFPAVNAAQPRFGGGLGSTGFSFSDGFVSKVDPTGSRLVYSTYLGGYADGWNDTGRDTAVGVAVDQSGAAYVTGISGSAEFPIVWPLAQTADQKLGAFVTRFDPEGKITFSTAFGHLTSGAAVALDRAGNSYAVGSVRWSILPVVQGFQPAFGGETDAFLIKIGAPGMLAVEFSSPENGAAYPVGATIDLSVRITGGETPVRRVDYYAGSLLIGTSSNPPFSIAWSSPVPATYALGAVATDASGRQVSSVGDWSVVSTNGRPAFPDYTLQPLQATGGQVTAAGINNLGQVTGWTEFISRWNTYSAFLWENGVLTQWTAADFTGGRSINDHGDVVGAATRGFPSQDPHQAALIYSNKIVYLKDTNLPFASPTIVGELLGNNNQRQAVGYGLLTRELFARVNAFAFLWENGEVTVLPALGDESATAVAINDRGQIVGSSFAGPSSPLRLWSPPPTVPYFYGRAVLWESGLVTDLNTLLPANSGWVLQSAMDINSAGQIIGIGHKDGNPSAFLFDHGTVVALSAPGETNRMPAAINDQGQIVGTRDGHAFLWQNGQDIDLNALLPSNTDWVLTSAADINNRGQIVGQGSHGAFVLDPKPLFHLSTARKSPPSSGEFELSAVAPPGQNVVLEASEDLRQWQPISTNKAAAARWLLAPRTSERVNWRFYRGAVQP